MLIREAEEMFEDFYKQVWNDESKLCLMAQFIQDQNLVAKFQEYLQTVADEDEEDDDEDEEDDDEDEEDDDEDEEDDEEDDEDE